MEIQKKSLNDRNKQIANLDGQIGQAKELIRRAIAMEQSLALLETDEIRRGK